MDTKISNILMEVLYLVKQMTSIIRKLINFNKIVLKNSNIFEY